MRIATTSLKIFGLYMMFIPGLGLMIMPAFVLDLFALHHADALWTARVVGLLAFIIGSYQLTIARLQIQRLYRLTVWQRYGAAAFFVGLWIAGEAGIAILLFALIDMLGASLTLFASSPEQTHAALRAQHAEQR